MIRPWRTRALAATTALGIAGGCVVALQRQIRREIFQADACRDEIAVASERCLLSSGAPHEVPILYSASRPGRPTVVFLHANAQAVASVIPLFDDLERDGFGVAAIEYVGYGPAASGRPSERKILRACEDGIRMLLKRPEVGQIILVGYSLGCVFATALAAKGYGDRLVLAAPFTSAAAVARSADETFPLSMARELTPAFPRGHLVVLARLTHGGTGARIGAAVRAVDRDVSRWPRTEEQLLSSADV